MLIHNKILTGVISILVFGIPTKGVCMEDMDEISKYGVVSWEGNRPNPNPKKQLHNPKKQEIRQLKVDLKTYKVNDRGIASFELDDDNYKGLEFNTPKGVYLKDQKAYVIKLVDLDELISKTKAKRQSRDPNKLRKEKGKKGSKSAQKTKEKEDKIKQAKRNTQKELSQEQGKSKKKKTKFEVDSCDGLN